MWVALIPIVMSDFNVCGNEEQLGWSEICKLYRLRKIYDNFRIMASDMEVDDDATYSID